MSETEFAITTLEAAYDALDSYDPAATKRALRYLVDAGEISALPRILPLTQHPQAAIRFVAKRAAQELRSLPPERHRRPSLPSPGPEPQRLPTRPPRPSPEAQARPQVVHGAPLSPDGPMDPRLEALLAAPPRRRPRRVRAGGVPMRWFDMEL